MTTMARWRLAGLVAAGLLGTSACLDDSPTGPDGNAGAGQLVPATAWLEPGARLALSLDGGQAFSLVSSDPAVAAIEPDGAVRAVQPGRATIRAFTPFGRSESVITVVPPVATRTPVVADSGLTDASLLGLWIVDRDVSYAAGVPGVLLQTTDGGRTWRTLDPGTGVDLTAIWASGRDDVWVVGANGTIVHFDGTAFTSYPTNTTAPLLHVWGRSRTEVYAVGLGVAFRFDGVTWHPMQGAAGSELWSVWGPPGGGELFASGQNGVLLRWDGSVWRPMQSPTQFVLFGLSGTSAADVYAAGIRGTVLRFDGDRWNPVAVPTGADLFAIAGFGSHRLLAVGNGGAMLVRDGATWGFAPQTATAENLRAVQFDPDGVARAVGWSGTIIRGDPGGWITEITSPLLFGSAVDAGGRVWAVGALGAVYRSDPSGWHRESVPVRRDLFGVSRAADGTLIVVGDAGTVLHRNGAVWSQDGGAPRVLLRSIWTHPTKPDLNVIAGEGGTILMGSAGRWRQVSSGTTAFFRHVHGLNEDLVFAVGDSGTIVRGEAGRFAPMPSPTDVRLRGVWVRARDDAHAVGEQGVALRFDGKRWYRVPTPTTEELRAVFGAGPTDVYAVGHEGTMLRFDGVAWRALPAVSARWLLGLGPGSGDALLAAGVNRTLIELRR